MKRILTLAVLAASCLGALAQQALWGQSPYLSPEINADNTVTFRLKAPKAVRVQLTGDFLPAQKVQTPRGEFEIPGVADMTETDGGMWQFTTPEPLAPELYSYTMLVDADTCFKRFLQKTSADQSKNFSGGCSI